MLVTIWRHGEAAPGEPDRLRRLTSRGEAEVLRLAADYQALLAQRRLPPPSALWFSRWLRTAQTAALIGAVLDAVPQRTEAALIPDQPVERVEDSLDGLDLPHVLLVSHQPLVSALIDRWLGDPGLVPALMPGAWALLSLNVPAPGCAELLAWRAPADARHAG